MKHMLNDHTNIQISKKIKPLEALQELYRLKPGFNGKIVYFFYRKTRYVEGLLVYDKKDKTFYVFDKKTNEKLSTFASWIKFLKNKRVFSRERLALATIFFEPNSSSFNLTSFNKTIHYVSMAKICTGQKTKGFELVVKLRVINLVRNQKNSDNIHEPFAILENQSQHNETYRRIDCHLLKITNKDQASSASTKVEEEEERMPEELKLIRIQNEKANEVRYHPMSTLESARQLLCWIFGF
ncbi:hypothetical protein GLOIN_2v1486843 [Rhizophagus clarus]|uniref:Uncharacterized protein n=1 Tax=Rhizophagus clarus TaxID=94130 RepID=A0A8H3R1X5_9GLOM|nr:hypothetical protein GLOIN_2v1486843 [Rhizophagus clarus]